MFDISSRERAKFVSRHVRLHPQHPEIGPLGLLLGTREYNELVYWHRPKQGTSRLTGGCLSGPVINKFLSERGGANTFSKQIHKGLLTAAAGQYLSANIAYS